MSLDILLASGMDLLDEKEAMPQVGQVILKKLLKPHFTVEQVDFDVHVTLGKFRYGRTYDETVERMADYLLAMNSKIIGFYTICNSFITVVNVSACIHRKNPDVILFYGGPHATMTWKHCLEELPFLTCVCMGESEYSIVPLVRTLLEGGPLAEVPGVAWRNADGKAERNIPCGLVPETELQKYAVYDLDAVYTPGHAKMFIEGGRGCPFQCSFCSTRLFWQQKFRVKPVEDIIREMDVHYERGGFDSFSIEHDMFTANRKHLKQFCETLIGRGSPYTWACSSRIDVLDEESIRMMAKAGCREIFLGIETGSPRMQDRIDKHLNLKDAVPKVILMQRLGILVRASFIYGLVGETEEDFLQTLDLLRHLYLEGVRDCQLHRFFPLPETPDAARIRDQIYFDEYDIDMSIASRKAMTPENRELIRNHPDLFLHYYTFKSEVRQKYRWADSLAVLTGNTEIYYPHTTDLLLEKLDYQQLYLKYEEIFKELSLCFSLEGPAKLKALIDVRLRDIVEREAIPEVSAMYRYEDDVRRFLREGNREARVVTYPMDINRALKKKEYIMEPFRAMMALDPEKNAVRFISIPAWMKMD